MYFYHKKNPEVICIISAEVSTFVNDVITMEMYSKYRKMTSSCSIVTKTSGNVSLHDIMLWFKYEVVLII